MILRYSRASLGINLRRLSHIHQGIKRDPLPHGAAQFKRLLSLRSDLPVILKRVREGGAGDSGTSIDKKEWDALSDFMRKIHKGGDDMKSYSYLKGGVIYDP